MRRKPLRTEDDAVWDRKIGAALAFIRNRDCLQTQSEFATRFGISRSHMANIETGRTPMPVNIGWSICKTLDLNPTWLISGGKGEQSRFPLVGPNNFEVIERYLKAAPSAPFRDVWPPVAHLAKPDDEISARAALRSSSGKPMVDIGENSGKVTSVSSEKIPTWKELVAKLKSLTEEPGAKARLASDLKTSRQNVNKWLSGSGMPSAELTLAVYRWVKEHE